MTPTTFQKIARAFVRFLHRILAPIDIVGLENVPASGAAILCANHQSLTDPISLICALDRWVRYMAKVELFTFAPLGALLRALGAFPVDRGGNDLASLRTSLSIIKDDGLLGIFPQGRRAFKGGGAFHNGAAMIAMRSGAPVIPVYIPDRARFFRRTRIVVGPPVDLSAYAAQMNSQHVNEATQAIESAIFALKM